MERKKFYIAYGSNLNVDQMARRCPGAEVVGVATLKDWRLAFRGSRSGYYLTIERSKGDSVPVAVWEITAQDEKNLDYYEGYPHFYYKSTMRVEVESRLTGETRTVDAMVYIMPASRRAIGIPSPYYVEVCRDGYDTFLFDYDPLDNALKNAWKAVYA